MEKQTATLSDVQEVEWTQSVGTILTGLFIVLVTAILIYFTRFWFEGSARMGALFAMSMAFFVGFAIVALGVVRIVKARSASSATHTCPYCDAACRLSLAPTEDFVCEHCNRTVHFEEGEAVQVMTLTCTACQAEHRVAINSARYLCDRCNRPVALPFLAPDSGSRSFETDGLVRNYDVLLVGYNHIKENDLAFKVQNLMVVNLPEAKRLIQSVKAEEPLVIGYNLPERKAESVKHQLTELGGHAVVRLNNGTTRVG